MSLITVGSASVATDAPTTALNASVSALSSAALSLLGLPVAAIRMLEQRLEQSEAELADWNAFFEKNPQFAIPKDYERLIVSNSKRIEASDLFRKQTTSMDASQRKLFATWAAAQRTPLGTHINAVLSNSQTDAKTNVEALLKKATTTYAQDNFARINRTVTEAAKVAGFTAKEHVHQKTAEIQEVSLVDEKGRILLVSNRMDADGTPNLSLDLEGFSCDSADCDATMQSVLDYLLKHGIEYRYKRVKHNNPKGVLRELLKKTPKKQANGDDYLQGKGNSTPPNKQVI